MTLQLNVILEYLLNSRQSVTSDVFQTEKDFWKKYKNAGLERIGFSVLEEEEYKWIIDL